MRRDFFFELFIPRSQKPAAGTEWEGRMNCSVRMRVLINLWPIRACLIVRNYSQVTAESHCDSYWSPLIKCGQKKKKKKKSWKKENEEGGLRERETATALLLSNYLWRTFIHQRKCWSCAISVIIAVEGSIHNAQADNLYKHWQRSIPWQLK